MSRSAGHVQRRITRYWDERAPAYDAHQHGQIEGGPLREAWREVWRRALPEPPGEVLDVGTGTGRVAHLAAELGHRVRGIDPSEGMLERARRGAAGLHPTPSFSRGDALAAGLAEEAFDAVTARYVLWTLPDPDAALRRWRRLLRDGGRLAIVDGTWFPGGIDGGGALPDAFHRDYGEVLAALPLATAHSIDGTVAAVRRAGFADVTLTPLDEVEVLSRLYHGGEEQAARRQYLVAGLRA